MIGCLITRLDIAFAVGKSSRYTSNPSTQHWQAIQRISNTQDNSSTSGWVFLLGGGAISWTSKKQTCITNSTIESEFVALAADNKEAKWLRNLILEIPLWSKPIAPINILCDCAATLAKAYNQMYNEKSRHLGVRHSMIRKLIMNGVVSIEFVRSQQNLADHLTKGLARDLVLKSAKGMAKDILQSLLITHQGNSQVKDNKIDLLVQQYEQFTILEKESIDSGFARFNTIITSLKALDEGFSSKNYVRKFLRALHPKWRAKVRKISDLKNLPREVIILVCE
ncbi:hypothetical protein Tco_0531835 [Tanacetum coccineum]